MWSYDVPRDLQKLCQVRLPLTVSNIIALGWDCWVRVLASWHWITTAAWRHSVSFGNKYLLWQCICFCNRKAFEQLQVASAVGDTLDLFAANAIQLQNRTGCLSTAHTEARWVTYVLLYCLCLCLSASLIQHTSLQHFMWCRRKGIWRQPLNAMKWPFPLMSTTPSHLFCWESYIGNVEGHMIWP